MDKFVKKFTQFINKFALVDLLLNEGEYTWPRCQYTWSRCLVSHSLGNDTFLVSAE